MRYSKPAAILLATFVLAASPIASATAYFQHGYTCSLAGTAAPYQEKLGYFNQGRFTNSSGASAYVHCPVLCDVGNTYYNIYTSASVMSCTMYTVATNGSYGNWGAGTRSSVNGITTFTWSNNACSRGSNAVEIQCTVPNGGSVFYYYAN